MHPLVPLTIFVSVSALIVLWPTRLSLDTSPIQSLATVEMLPLFALCMLVWGATLLWAGWGSQESRAGAALLATVTTAAVLGFWTLHRPDGIYEEPAKLADAVYIEGAGRVAPNVLLGYLAWPGTGFLAVSVASITGLSLPVVARVIVLATAASMGLFLFVFTSQLLRDNRLALLATMLAVFGNTWIMLFSFHPDYIGLTLFVGIVALGARVMLKRSSNAGDRACLITLGAAITVIHFMTSVLVLCLMASFWLAERVMRRSTTVRISTSTIQILTILPVAWTIYWSTTELNVLTKGVNEMFRAALRGDVREFYFYVGGIANADVVKVPLWANIVRLGWLGTLYGLGILLALAGLVLLRRLDTARVFASVGLLAVAGFAGLATVAGIGGQEYFRFIAYGSLFAAPLIVLWLLHWRYGGMAAMAAGGLLAIALGPTFLADNARVSDSAFYPWELSAARFFRTSTGAETPVYDLASSWSAILYERPTAVVVTPVFQIASISRDLGTFSFTMQNQVQEFLHDRSPNHAQEFLMTDKFTAAYAHQWGASAASRLRQELERELQAANLVYDAGRSKVYE